MGSEVVNTKFKVGDRVVVLPSDDEGYPTHHVGEEGVVEKVWFANDEDDIQYKVVFSNDEEYGLDDYDYFGDNHLELVHPIQVGGNHYAKMKIQPKDFILENGIGWSEGNAIAYLCRWRDKGGIQDLEKAIQQIEFLIEKAKKEQASA